MKNEMMLEQNELLASREPFYDWVDLLKSDIFCIDEREPLDVEEPYIHMAGGVLVVPYTGMVLKTIAGRGAADVPTFEEAAVQDIHRLQQNGVEGSGVHSDTHSEHGGIFRLNHTEGKVGCGYAELRATLSEYLYQNKDEILADAGRLFPELFDTPAGALFAQEVFAAHGMLAKHPSVIGRGRDVVRAAVQEGGAKSMVVGGSHDGEAGIINTEEDSSIKSGEVRLAGLPTYGHDLWASDELISMAHPEFTPQHIRIATVLDVIGTMKALGVQEIARR